MTFEERYDELYDRIISFMERVNPCHVCNGKCLRAQKGGRNFCCSVITNSKDSTVEKAVCAHLSEHGCKASKPIYCKIWLCSEALVSLEWNERAEFNKLLSATLRLANDLSIGDMELDLFRRSRDEIIQQRNGLVKQLELAS